jgi:hypothetical protein
MNFTYELPWINRRGMTGWIGGWQMSSVITLSDGAPFTARTGFNRSRDRTRSLAERPNLRARGSNNPVLGGPDRYFDPNAFELPPVGFYGNVGRNTLTAPGLANVDLSLVKVIPVTEQVKVDFRGEFFNLFNRANFGVPDGTIFNTNETVRGAAGRIQDTTTTSRQVQFGLKVLF